jgi:hypothetical protein
VKKSQAKSVTISFTVSRSQVNTLLTLNRDLIDSVGLDFKRYFEFYRLDEANGAITITILFFSPVHFVGPCNYKETRSYIREYLNSSGYQQKLTEIGCTSFTIGRYPLRGSKLIPLFFPWSVKCFSIVLESKKERSGSSLFFLLSKELGFNKFIYWEKTDTFFNSFPVFGFEEQDKFFLKIPSTRSDLKKRIILFLRAHLGLVAKLAVLF